MEIGHKMCIGVQITVYLLFWPHQFWKIKWELILHSIRIISANNFTNFSYFALTWRKLFRDTEIVSEPLFNSWCTNKVQLKIRTMKPSQHTWWWCFQLVFQLRFEYPENVRNKSSYSCFKIPVKICPRQDRAGICLGNWRAMPSQLSVGLPWWSG